MIICQMCYVSHLDSLKYKRQANCFIPYFRVFDISYVYSLSPHLNLMGCWNSIQISQHSLTIRFQRWKCVEQSVYNCINFGTFILIRWMQDRCKFEGKREFYRCLLCIAFIYYTVSNTPQDTEIYEMIYNLSNKSLLFFSTEISYIFIG